MGFLQDVWDGITSFFNTIFYWIGHVLKTIIGGIVSWVTKVIDGAIKAFRLWTHKFKVKLAEIMSTPLGFLGVIAATIIVIVGGAYLMGIPAVASFVKELSRAFSALENGVYSLLGALGYNTLFAVHKIVSIWSPEYHAMWTKLYQAISTFSADLALGIGTISSMLSASSHIGVAVGSALGVPKENMELLRVDKVSGFLNDLEARFEHYVMYPMSVFEDINQKVTIPMLEGTASIGQGMRNDLVNMNNSLNETADNLHDVKKAFDAYVNVLPDEIRKTVNQWYEPISERLQSIFDDKIFPFMDKVTKTFDVIDDYIEKYNESIPRIENKVGQPEVLIENYDKLPRDKQLEFLAQLSEILWSPHRIESDNLKMAYKTAMDELNEKYNKYIDSIPVEKERGKIKNSGIFPANFIPSNIEKWNQGEY